MTLASAAPIALAAETPDKTGTDALDHVLLWGRDIDQISAAMAVKLGFQVRPGRNPGGVANRYVRMDDRSYVELLGITRPDATLDPGMQADRAVLKGEPGSRSFGLRNSALDALRARLKAKGFAATDVFAAAPNDPDGQGPSKPPRWRLFAFERQPLSSNLFFIDYAAESDAPAHVADDAGARVHPNGAKSVSAFWLLSADAEADKRGFERMGFAGATPVRLPQVAARGYCVPVGGKRVFALQPDGAGIAADALRDGGPQVFGVSVEVVDVAAAKRRVERGYEQAIASYRGPLGDAFLAPTQPDLGMLIEFHATPTGATVGGCDGLIAPAAGG